MYAIIGMGEKPYDVEIPCMFFETKQAAEAYIAKIPWLRRCVCAGNDDSAVIYEIHEELYDKIIPPYLLTALPQKIIGRSNNNITYGKAVGLHFFTYYYDRRGELNHYIIWKVEPGEAFVGFGGVG
ncbi:MAG: hypothetical protein PVF36_07165 [Desulfobacterales bacterium]|jgi:hypothetical protein